MFVLNDLMEEGAAAWEIWRDARDGTGIVR
jgi:hypothetical protein